MKCLLQIVTAVVTLFIVGSLSSAKAQSAVFTYQGHVTDNGTNFSGSGQFKFALVTSTNGNNTVTYTTYWSNDGTSFNGSEPTAPVIVNVNNGLFTVVLGDTNQPNMTPIAASLFNQPNLQLRIWFNDGVSGSAALDPPQNLTPAPYATFANTASNLVNGLSVQQNANGAPNVLGGASVNYVSNGVVGATIAGGGAVSYEGSSYSNVVNGDFGTVGGGARNSASAVSATVGGGYANTVNGQYATVGGGQNNTVNGVYGTAGGGSGNTVNGQEGTVGGGFINLASGPYATVSGGFANQATNSYATVAGGKENVAGGIGSFAAGFFAQALHDGSFVWADSSAGVPFPSTTNNQFSVRSVGGVLLVTGTNGVKLGLTGQYFATGGGENLRMLRGVVGATGNILNGTGFAVTRTGVGAYTITFSSAFTDVPAVTVSAQSGLAHMATVTNVGQGSAQIRIFDNTGAAVDNQFHFIAIGLQ